MDIVDILTSRLRILMKVHNVKAAPLARRAQLNESAVRDILRGRSKNPGIVTLSRIASVMDLRPSALFEGGDGWPVVGVAGADGVIVSTEEEPVLPKSVENPFFEHRAAPFAAVLNRSAALAPFAFEGDYLIFRADAAGVDEQDFGRPCICELEDGRWLVRVVRMGDTPGKHHLMPVSVYGAPDMNMTLRSATRVALVLPELFVPNLPEATHEADATTLHEERATYKGKAAN